MRRYRSLALLLAAALGPVACGSSGSDGGSNQGTASGNGTGDSTNGGNTGGANTGGGGNTGTSHGASTGATSGSGGAGTNGSASASASGGGSASTGGTSASAGSANSQTNHSGSSSSGNTGGTSASSTSSAGGSSTSGTGCGAGDSKLPAEPTFPAACTTLTASQNVAADGVPAESNFDTSRLQSALNGCASGQAVKLTSSSTNNAFITGPITIPKGVTLWVDAGATLYGTRDPNVYNGAAALIAVNGADSGIVGDGVIDGQGGEPQVGSTQTWWDVNGGGGSSPALISVSGASNFTLYKITLHNAPMFHVKLAAAGFVVWGITIKTPSKSTNMAGTALTPTSAHNTDGVDPGESASNGYIVCNDISDGDDHIAIKGGTSVKNLTIAHNHFLAGHGMSIGSETNGGVSGIDVYDLSIDGTGSGLGGGSSNGIRIKSDPSRGGMVSDVTYSDVCVRELANPIIITPHYSSTATGTLIPEYTGITIQNFHSLASSVKPMVTLDGYDASHLLGITLDNVVVDGITSSEVTSEYANVTEGPGAVNFTPSGTSVTVTNDMSGSSTPNPCTNKWVTF